MQIPTMAPADVTFRDWCCFAAATKPFTAVEVFLLSGDAVGNVVGNFVETSTHLQEVSAVETSDKSLGSLRVAY